MEKITVVLQGVEIETREGLQSYKLDFKSPTEGFFEVFERTNTYDRELNDWRASTPEEEQAQNDKISEFYGVPADELKTLVGNEFEFYLNHEDYRLYKQEPVKYADMTNVKDMFKGEIVKVQYFNQDRLNILVQAPDDAGVVKVAGMNFTKFNADQNAPKEFLGSKQVKAFKKLNLMYSVSDVYEGEDLTPENIADVLIGKTAKMEKGNYNNHTFFSLTDLS